MRDFASGICDLANRSLRSLMRHRERYVKAWMAHYGVESFDGVEMVETHFPEGTTITFLRPIMSEADALREVIKQAEWSGPGEWNSPSTCPWCHELEPHHNGHDHPRGGKHAENCPAFTPDGKVR